MTLSFFTVLYNNHRTPKLIEKRDTTIIRDTIWKDTTITEKQVIPKIIVKKKVDTVYTPQGDTLQLLTESKMFDKRFISSKDTCDLQIYTTGINTSLDSLKWRLKTHRVNTVETVTITKYVEHNKLRITPQVGMGYGVFNKQCDMYIGLGFSYNF
jgi:hypothetical protein